MLGFNRLASHPGFELVLFYDSWLTERTGHWQSMKKPWRVSQKCWKRFDNSVLRNVFRWSQPSLHLTMVHEYFFVFSSANKSITSFKKPPILTCSFFQPLLFTSSQNKQVITRCFATLSWPRNKLMLDFKKIEWWKKKQSPVIFTFSSLIKFIVLIRCVFYL